MRVQIYRTMNRPAVFVRNHNNHDYRVPQDISDGLTKETITMYSRPSAFGPPTHGHVSSGSTVSEPYEKTGVVRQGPDTFISVLSQQGMNYPYTPPYYHGRSWADIVYKSGGRTGRVQLDEIIASSSVTYRRFDQQYIHKITTTVPLRGAHRKVLRLLIG